MPLSLQVFASIFIILWASQQGASIADSCRRWGCASCRFWWVTTDDINVLLCFAV